MRRFAERAALAILLVCGLTVQAEAVTLTLDKSQAGVGEDVLVSWNANNDWQSGDRIRMVRSDGWVARYYSISFSNRVHSDFFNRSTWNPVPSEGSYNIRYERSSGNVAASVSLQVGGGSSGPICGNGIKESGEGCDDGNNTNGDGCSSTCQVEQNNPICGNGIKESGEECDDGNNVSGDGCSVGCLIESGGDPCDAGGNEPCVSTPSSEVLVQGHSITARSVTGNWWNPTPTGYISVNFVQVPGANNRITLSNKTAPVGATALASDVRTLGVPSTSGLILPVSTLQGEIEVRLISPSGQLLSRSIPALISNTSGAPEPSCP